MNSGKMPALLFIYMLIMWAVSISLLLVSFLNGFRPADFKPLSFLLMPVLVLTILLGIIYDIAVLILHLFNKRTPEYPLAVFFPFILIILVFTMPILNYFGQETAISFAGRKALINDADKLMSNAGRDIVELPEKEYPDSFRRLGAFRVFFNDSSVELTLDGWVSKKYGITISSSNKGPERISRFERN
ncbi:MAG: hypothetical protein WC481_02640 [Candidatus Omnitrophota bacterium]